MIWMVNWFGFVDFTFCGASDGDEDWEISPLMGMRMGNFLWRWGQNGDNFIDVLQLCCIGRLWHDVHCSCRLSSVCPSVFTVFTTVHRLSRSTARFSLHLDFRSISKLLIKPSWLEQINNHITWKRSDNIGLFSIKCASCTNARLQNGRSAF